MRRITSQIEGQIIEDWFQGRARDDIARRRHASGDTVSRVVNSFPLCMQELRDLSTELRKNHGSSTDPLKGAKLLSKLAVLGVELDEVPSFIKSVNKFCAGTQYVPKDVVQASM